MSSSPTPASDVAAGDTWRTRMLAFAVLPLFAVAIASVFVLADDLHEYLADADLRAITRPALHLLTPIATTAARLTIAVAALLALCWRRRPTRSQRALVLGYAAMLPLLVLPHLVPMAWAYDLPPEARDEVAKVWRAAGPALAGGGILDLLPLLPSIAVGLSRAGLHRLAVDAADSVGALVTAVASLNVALVGATVFAGIEPLVGGHLAVLGLGLLTAHYALAATLCLQFARRGRRAAGAGRTLLRASSLLVLLPGIGCLLWDLGSLQLFDVHLIAVGDHAGLMSPVQAGAHLLEFAGRALVTAAFAGDLLQRATASAAP